MTESTKPTAVLYKGLLKYAQSHALHEQNPVLTHGIISLCSGMQIPSSNFSLGIWTVVTSQMNFLHRLMTPVTKLPTAATRRPGHTCKSIAVVTETSRYRVTLGSRNFPDRFCAAHRRQQRGVQGIVTN